MSAPRTVDRRTVEAAERLSATAPITTSAEILHTVAAVVAKAANREGGGRRARPAA